MRHNHPTRDIKPPGVCPGCDDHHAPKNARAVLQNGSEVSLERRYGGERGGNRNWIYVTPDDYLEIRIDKPMPDNTSVSFISAAFDREVRNRVRLATGRTSDKEKDHG